MANLTSNNIVLAIYLQSNDKNGRYYPPFPRIGQSQGETALEKDDPGKQTRILSQPPGRSQCYPDRAGREAPGLAHRSDH